MAWGKLTLASYELKRACELAAQGRKLDEIYTELGFTSPWDWDTALSRLAHTDREQFVRARRLGLEVLADRRLLDEAGDARTLLDIKRKEVVDANLRWLLSKRIPDTYGSTVTVKVERPDLRAALEGIDRRARQVDEAREKEQIGGVDLLAHMLSEE